MATQQKITGIKAFARAMVRMVVRELVKEIPHLQIEAHYTNPKNIKFIFSGKDYTRKNIPAKKKAAWCDRLLRQVGVHEVRFGVAHGWGGDRQAMWVYIDPSPARTQTARYYHFTGRDPNLQNVPKDTRRRVLK